MLLIRHFLVRCQNWLVIQIVIAGYKKPPASLNLVRLGSSYGGWWVPQSILKRSDISRVAISAGLGFDVTFDRALLESGFSVIGLDPLHECITYANAELEPYPNFHSIAKGLWRFSGIETFFPPKIQTHDSWSTSNIHNSPSVDAKTFDVISIEDLYKNFTKLKTAQYRLLKMDVEGSEVELIKVICASRYQVDFLAVEMDCLSLIPFLNVSSRLAMIKVARSLMRLLKTSGYKLVKTENFNFFWVFCAKKSTLPTTA